MTANGKKHYIFTDFGDHFLGETAEDLKAGNTVRIGGADYKVVGDSGDSRQYHEIYVVQA